MAGAKPLAMPVGSVLASGEPDFRLTPLLAMGKVSLSLHLYQRPKQAQTATPALPALTTSAQTARRGAHVSSALWRGRRDSLTPQSHTHVTA